MPALANPTQKPKRALFAQMLVHMAIGLGISAGGNWSTSMAYCQSCDRCVERQSPHCGCESEGGTKLRIKQCVCPPTPSLGEKLLAHLDRMGDRFESKSKKPCNGRCDQAAMTCSDLGPACSCESQAVPTCGCEVKSIQLSGPTVPRFHPSQMGLLHPTARDSNGSIGDKTVQARTPPDGRVPQSNPSMLSPEPIVQRFPFETTKSTNEHNRIPAFESMPANSPMTNGLKPTPQDSAPSWVPNPSRSPTNNPPPQRDSQFPDVLVDPFKDDASFRRTKQKAEGILLTGHPKKHPNALRLASSDEVALEEVELAPAERPARLTPSQLDTPESANEHSLQFEAADSASNASSQIVASSYIENMPVKVVARQLASKSDVSEKPLVPKIRVPQKR